MPLHRADEITYYEDLGVTRKASPEEIRDAFRALVRLLHPDHQTDEQLKNTAEAQMRKINRIYSVLSDPERRLRYDDSLQEARSAPTIVFSPGSNVNVQRLMARFAWVGAVLITVIGLVWLASEGPAAAPLPPSSDRALAAKPSGSDALAQIAQLRSELNLAKSERDAAVQELIHLHHPIGRKPEIATTLPETNLPLPPPSTATTITELPSSARVAPAPLPTTPPTAPPARMQPAVRTTPAFRQFAGFWFYTRPPQGQHNKNNALYPPEFIEATLTEQNGVVHGRYRSRYQIVDRAISPDVNFEFTGTPNGSGIACPWSGPGGSRGELTLRVTGENTMEIEWSASELGSLQGLVSGTAKLARRVE